MAILLRLYYENEFQETEIVPNQNYFVGGTAKDDICFKEAGLPRRAFSIKTSANDWTITVLNKELKKNILSESPLRNFEETIVLDMNKHMVVTVYKSGPEFSQAVDISTEDRIIIGRSSSCDITVNSARVSSRHLELKRQGKPAGMQDPGN